MSPKAKDFLARWLINTFAVVVATQMVSGISYDNKTALVVATFLLGILNTFVRPVLLIFALPFLVLTLGLFTLVINAFLLEFVAYLEPAFHVKSFWAAFWGGLVISIVSFLLNVITGTGSARVNIRRGTPPPPRGGNDGGGPVIDV